ncbi:hypothetical protein [Nocardia brasiliensis]|uniref:hypothetical protein n=1 Tax=Nocardia brasiliensis TaxID=37326 RepID=UPI003670C71F
MRSPAGPHGGCGGHRRQAWKSKAHFDYVPLLVLAAVAGRFDVPIFTVVRQAVIAATTEENRQPALALEAVSVEMAFMVGPILGVAAASLWSPRSYCSACNGRWYSPAGHPAAPAVPRRAWFGIEFVALCVGASAAISLLAASELTFVSAVREFGAQQWLGVVLAALGAVTIPMAFAVGPISLAITGLLAGIFCAPTITASIDQMSRIVPEGGRGEAIGWHSAALTLGNGISSSMAGIAIDAGGFAAGFTAAATLGLTLGLALLVGIRERRRLAIEKERVEVGQAIG